MTEPMSSQEFAKGLVAWATKVVFDAESHLKVPTGTLFSLQKDNDYLAVMKVASTVEPLLHDGLEAEIKRLRKYKVEHEGSATIAAYVRNNGRFADKAKLARDLGLIREKHYDFICAVQKIRNGYAHHIENLHLSALDVIRKNNMDLAQTFNAVGFFSFLPDETSSENNARLMSSIYFAFAQFLAAELEVINPPPMPAFGILSSAFAKHSEATKTDTPLPLQVSEEGKES